MAPVVTTTSITLSSNMYGYMTYEVMKIKICVISIVNCSFRWRMEEGEGMTRNCLKGDLGLITEIYV